MKDFLKFVQKAGTNEKAGNLLGLSHASISRKKTGSQLITKQDLMLIQLPIKILEDISKKAKKS